MYTLVSTERYLELEKQLEEVRDTNKPFCLGFFDADDNQLDLIKQKLTHPFLDVGEFVTHTVFLHVRAIRGISVKGSPRDRPDQQSDTI